MKDFQVGEKIHLPDGSRGIVEEIHMKKGNIRYPYQYLYVDMNAII